MTSAAGEALATGGSPTPARAVLHREPRRPRAVPLYRHCGMHVGRGAIVRAAAPAFSPAAAR